MTCLLLHDEDTKYDKLLHQHNIPTVTIPVLETVILPVSQLISQIPSRDLTSENATGFRKHVQSFDGYIITSRHAVSFLVENKVDVRGKYLAVVGPQTSAKVLDYCLTQDYHPQENLIMEHHGEALANKIIQSSEDFPLSWIFFRGNKSLEIIPDKLKETKISLSQLTVYKITNRADLDVRLGMVNFEDIMFVVFFSPSGVGYTSNVLSDKLQQSTILIAFGKSTCREIQKLLSDKVNDIRTCSEPTPQGVLNAIMQ